MTSIAKGVVDDRATFSGVRQVIGVERRIAALILDCERAMRDYPDGGDRRWFWRLEDQHRRLLQPDLRLIAAVATRLAEETPALAGPVAAAMKELVLKEPDLRPLLQRLQRCDPGGAQNVSRPASGGPLQSQRPHRLTAAQA